MSVNLPILTVAGLTVLFRGVLAVQSFDLRCEQGTLTVLTGPNGVGKSTVLNAIAGVCPKSAGTMDIGGVPVGRNWTPHKAYAAGVRRSFQIPRNWTSLSIFENVALPSDVPASDLGRRIRTALPGVEIDRSPATLSLGQRRMLELLRLELSRGDCRLALLDEPLSGLDESNAAEITARVGMLRQRGAAVLVVDHEPERWSERSQTVFLPLPSVPPRHV